MILRAEVPVHPLVGNLLPNLPESIPKEGLDLLQLPPRGHDMGQQVVHGLSQASKGADVPREALVPIVVTNRLFDRQLHTGHVLILLGGGMSKRER